MLTYARKEARKVTALIQCRRWGLPVINFHKGWNLGPPFWPLLQPTSDWMVPDNILKAEEIRSVPSVLKSMASVFWNFKRVILLTFCLGGTTVDYACLVETLRSLNTCLCWVSSTRILSEVLLVHNNTRPHACVGTTNIITELGQTFCCTVPTVLIFHHQIFICLFIGKTACKGTITWMVWQYRTLFTSSFRGRRSTFTRQEYMLLFKYGSRLSLKMGTVLKLTMLYWSCEFVTCVTCKYS